MSSWNCNTPHHRSIETPPPEPHWETQSEPVQPNPADMMLTPTSTPTRETTPAIPSRQSQAYHDTLPLEIRPSMDLCNLFVKRLHFSLKSSDLYNAFASHGRIISASVMTNPATGRSRGFGFVSYSHPVEAATALLAMNGTDIYLSTKPVPSGMGDPKKEPATISVRFHEPCVPRPEHDHQQQALLLARSPLAPYFKFCEGSLPPTQPPHMPVYPVPGVVSFAPVMPQYVLAPPTAVYYVPYVPPETYVVHSPYPMHIHHHPQPPAFRQPIPQHHALPNHAKRRNKPRKSAQQHHASSKPGDHQHEVDSGSSQTHERHSKH